MAGHRWWRRVSWDVTSAVRAIPSGFVASAAEGSVSRSVLVESDEMPFRIIAVANPLAVGAVATRSLELARSHTIKLEIDPGRAKGQRIESIRIATDHPAQPEVIVSVVVVSSQEGSAR
jgi:hypothetical protein